MSYYEYYAYPGTGSVYRYPCEGGDGSGEYARPEIPDQWERTDLQPAHLLAAGAESLREPPKWSTRGADDADGEFIRGYYRVPAHIGAKILFEGYPGVITGFDGPHLLARVEGYGERPVILHPTWEVEYLPADDPTDEKGTAHED